LRQEIAALATVPTTNMINGDFRSLLNLSSPVHVLNPVTGQDFSDTQRDSSQPDQSRRPQPG